MNHRARTLRTALVSRVLKGLTILLLPAWLPDTAHPTVLSRRRQDPTETNPSETNSSEPYLRTIGPPPLRFGDAPLPPPALVARPVAGGPPQPVAHATAPATPPAGSPPTPASAPAPEKPTAESPPAGSPRSAAPATPPPAILPDEIRPKVREEDFLPFFQFPTGGDVTASPPAPPAPPAPGQPPPSSATYRQQ